MKSKPSRSLRLIELIISIFGNKFTLSPLQNSQPFYIIYTQGIAYFQRLVLIHWMIIGKLIKHLGASLTVPIYPLTPEHTYRDTFPMLEAFYRDVLKKCPDRKILSCSDLAGAAPCGQPRH